MAVSHSHTYTHLARQLFIDQQMAVRTSSSTIVSNVMLY